MQSIITKSKGEIENLAFQRIILLFIFWNLADDVSFSFYFIIWNDQCHWHLQKIISLQLWFYLLYSISFTLKWYEIDENRLHLHHNLSRNTNKHTNKHIIGGLQFSKLCFIRHIVCITYNHFMVNDWFGLVSLFDSISTFVGYLMPNTFLSNNCNGTSYLIVEWG